MECTQILVESEEDSPEPSTRERRQVATLETDGDSYPIFIGENRIGRDPKTCSIVIDNMALSSQHAVIEGLSCGSFLIYDLNSRNKTRIGKMSLTPQVRYQLKNGESIRFANVQCTFCMKESINLVHLSFDDDIEELKSDPKEEDTNNSSAGDDSIFDAETQRPDVMEKPSKATEEKEESMFKLPQQIQNINTSIISLDESVRSNGDDIFDLPTQPFTCEEGTRVDIKGKERLEEKSKDSDKSSRAERVTKVDTDKENKKEDAEKNIEDKNKSMDESDLDELFAAATQAYPSENDKVEEDKKEADDSKSYGSDGESSDKNIPSSVDKGVDKNELLKGLEDMNDSVDDVFDLPTQAFSTEEEPQQQGGSTAADKEPSSSTVLQTKVNVGEGEEGDGVSESKESNEVGDDKDESMENEDDSDIDIFAVATQLPPGMEAEVEKDSGSNEGDGTISKEGKNSSPNDHIGKKGGDQVLKDHDDSNADNLSASDNKQKVKEKEEVEKIQHFSAEEDSDDRMLASLSQEVEKSLGAISTISGSGGKDSKMQGTSLASAQDVQNKKEDAKWEEVVDNETDGDETDPEDSFNHKIEEKEAHSSDNVEKKKEVSDGSCVYPDDDANVTPVSAIRADIDDDDDTDLEDMCPPSVKKPLLTQKSAFRKANDRDRTKLRIGEPSSSISSATVTSTVEGSCGDSKMDLSRKDDGSFRVLVDATFEDSLSTENQPESIVIMSDTDDEKEMDDSPLKKSKERHNKKKLKTLPAEALEEKSTDASENIPKVDTSNKEKEEKVCADLITSKESVKIGTEQIGADKEDEDDMSSFLTQAPPDFKTPQALKQESVDESDISILETQPPPFFENPTSPKKADKEDSSNVNQSSTSNVDEEDKDDMSSFLTQAPPEFKTPQAFKVTADDSDSSILETRPPTTLTTPKVSNGKNEEESVNSIADDEEEDDMSSFLTQAPPDFKTPQAIKVESVDESDVSMLETQPPPSEPTAASKVSVEQDVSDVMESSPSKVNTGENEEDEDDMSSFLTQAPPDFKTPQAIKAISADESDIGDLETQPSSLETQKVLHGEEKEGLTKLSAASEVNTAVEKEEEDDMSSFPTQAPPEVKICEALPKNLDNESEISLLEKEPLETPLSKTANVDLSAVQSSTSKANTSEDVEDKDDSSSIPVQAHLDIKTPKTVKEKSVDESDISLPEIQPSPVSETPVVTKKADKEDSRAVDVKQSSTLNITAEEEDEDDMSSFLTQAPPEFKTPLAMKGDKSAEDSDISMLETQPAPSETPEVPKRTDKELGTVDMKESSAINNTVEEEDEDDLSPFLTQAPPEFKTPMAVKDDKLVKDSGILETEPGPSEAPNVSNEKLDVQEEEIKLETSLAITEKGSVVSEKESKETFSEVRASKPVNDEDDVGLLETQPPPNLKENVIEDDEGEEDMSSFLTQAPPDFQTPKALGEKLVKGKEDKDAQHPQALKNLEESHESDEEDMSSFLTQAPPDFCPPKVAVKKEPEDQQLENPHGISSVNKETDNGGAPLDSVTEEKVKTLDTETKIEGKEDDLEICETQPALKSVCQKSLSHSSKEPVCPMSTNPGIEDVSSDEEDVSLLETQPAPVPEKVVNGKKEIIDIFKQPSKVFKEVTPSRTLRKKFLQKTQKEAGVSPSVKESKTTEDLEDNDDDSDVGGFLPDTPDLAMTMQESKWSTHSVSKNLFNDDSKVKDGYEISQETSETDVDVNSPGVEGDLLKPSEDKKKIAEKKQPEFERRNPTRGSKKLVSENNISSRDTHKRPNRKQKEQSNNDEDLSSPKSNAEASPDLSSKKDKPLLKRRGLRDKRSKAMDEEESKSPTKENNEKQGPIRKVNLRKRAEVCPEEVIKSEANSMIDEPAKKRGRPNKRHAEDDVKAKTSERLSAASTKSTGRDESEIMVLEVKHVEVKDTTKASVNKETVGKRRRLSHLIEEVSVEGKAADKSPSDVLSSSPRKRHLRGEDREVQPPTKELRVRKKDDKSTLKSKNEETVPAHRLRGNNIKEDQSRKEVPSSPTILRKRKLDIPVKPEPRSSSKTPESNVVEGVRRSVRERKPKRRFSSEERPNDDGLPSIEEGRRGKITRLNKKEDTHEKDASEPESAPQEAKKRKLDEKKVSGGTKRTRSSIVNSEQEDSVVFPSDKRRRKGRLSSEKSAADVSKTEVKEHGGQKDERSTRGSSKRGTRESNVSEQSISTEKIAEASPMKVNVRGRRRSSKQCVPESMSQQSEESGRSSSNQDHQQQTPAPRGSRRGNRSVTSSNEPVPVSSSVEVTSSEIVTSSQKMEVESSVEEKTNSGRRRGRKRASSQGSAVDKEDKVSSSTSPNPKQENFAFGADLSYLKSSPVKGRMTTFSPRAASSSDSASEDNKQKAIRSRRQKGESYSVLFTGLNEPKLGEMVHRLGGKVVESPKDCSILVTDRLRRTYKLLCVVARGIPIVTAQWVAQSSAIGRFLDPADFFISDKLTEKRFNFSLKTSLEKARTKPLLAGFSVIATPSVKPPPEEIKGIVASAGGEYLPDLSALQHKIPSQLYVISCQDDSALWKNYLECGAKKRPSRLRSERGKGKSADDGSNVRLIGVEGLLVSILRQKIDLDDKMFSLG